MSQTVSPSTSRCYGLARVSRAGGGVSRAGVYRFLKGAPSPAIARRRPGPTGPWPDADLADHLRREIEASDFHHNGEAIADYGARLRVAGVRSSPRRVRRVMGENRLLRPIASGTNQRRRTTEPIVTDKVNEMWGTDAMSQTVTIEEGRAYVSVAVEHANSEIIGIHAARSANRFEALEPVNGSGYVSPSAPSRPAWRVGSSCVTIMAPSVPCPAISRARSNVWASKLRRPSCANPRAMASPSASSNLEEENLSLGADVQNHRGTLRRARRIRQALQWKLGSSRGMDTKRPRRGQRGANHATNCD